jgi:hypothetical protein
MNPRVKLGVKLASRPVKLASRLAPLYPQAGVTPARLRAWALRRQAAFATIAATRTGSPTRALHCCSRLPLIIPVIGS